MTIGRFFGCYNFLITSIFLRKKFRNGSSSDNFVELKEVVSPISIGKASDSSGRCEEELVGGGAVTDLCEGSGTPANSSPGVSQLGRNSNPGAGVMSGTGGTGGDSDDDEEYRR